ncbi:MAG: hypothetical protein GX754_05075 [Clostridiaceae bacterium]|nr:hypothetical protein [Clostridiaceae bacterium]
MLGKIREKTKIHIKKFFGSNYFLKLLISYFFIILSCILFMCILSYSFLHDSLNNQSIESNNRLLNQFKNTVDSLVLGSINELSIKIYHDSSVNPYISYYF